MLCILASPAVLSDHTCCLLIQRPSCGHPQSDTASLSLQYPTTFASSETGLGPHIPSTCAAMCNQVLLFITNCLLTKRRSSPAVAEVPYHHINKTQHPVLLIVLVYVLAEHAFYDFYDASCRPFVTCMIFMLACHIAYEDHLAMMQALLGDPCSRRSLRSAIHHFVSLRRYEQMSVHQALQGIKLSTVTAISSPSPHGEFAHLVLSAGTPCEQL